MEEVEGEEELGKSQFQGVTRAPACLTSSSSLSLVPLCVCVCVCVGGGEGGSTFKGFFTSDRNEGSDTRL